jgi:hypothetical protein
MRDVSVAKVERNVRMDINALFIEISGAPTNRPFE